MAAKKKQATRSSKWTFAFDSKIFLGGLFTYLVVMLVVLAGTFFLNQIFNTGGAFSERFYAIIKTGGAESYEQYLSFGNLNLVSGFILGVLLSTLLVFVSVSEWFNLHKLSDYRAALTWGFVWAATFLVSDLVVEYFYEQVVSLFTNSYSPLLSVSSAFGPLFLLFLGFVVLMPVVLLFIHKLSKKVSG